uniref:C3HC-type domain-containing protein n=1 Tax=Oryza nivara TaxID=4536 RepID=A0A0E0FPB8_ORYNI
MGWNRKPIPLQAARLFLSLAIPRKRKQRRPLLSSPHDASPLAADPLVSRHPSMAAGGGGGGGDIGADSERRLKKAMDKLYHFPKPKAGTGPGSSKPSSASTSSALSIGRAGRAAGAGGRRFGMVRGSRLPSQLTSMSAISPPPPCRPWDRADLMRRLATFKAMTWFAKPKVISPVNCARRGWINIEPDVITCEACEARLLFSTPSSWAPQQVEKAAAVFSLKLDNGHKLLCPWIDNICDESLALFPPTPPPVLVENYHEGFSSLLRLSALPRISCSSLESMKKRSPQLEQFLLKPFSSSVVLKGGFILTEDSTIKDLDDTFQDADTYYQALKIISLCGWEPRLLPYAVDCGTKSHSDANSSSTLTQPGLINNSMEDRVVVYSPNEVDGSTVIADARQAYQHYDPLSVVLDCQFCGACVALWPFSLVERPLQLFKLISDSSRQDEQTEGHAGRVSGAGPSKTANIGFNFTIAGGPPPTRQNFRPRVSLPVVSRHLKADLSSHGHFISSGSDNHMVPVTLHASGLTKRKRSMDESHMLEGNNTISTDADTTTNGADHQRENSVNGTSNLVANPEHQQGGSHSDTSRVTSTGEVSNEESETGHAAIKSHTSTDELGQHGSDPKSLPVEDSSNAHDLAKTCTNNSRPVQAATLTKSSNDGEKGASQPSGSQGLYDKLNEFDPMKQHRTFCPWICPDGGETLPGWRLTLSALLSQDKRIDEDSQVEPQISLLSEEDDPVTSKAFHDTTFKEVEDTSGREGLTSQNCIGQSWVPQNQICWRDG